MGKTRNLVEDSFLQWLHHEREHARIHNYQIFSNYYNGEHDIDIPKKIKAALESELGTVLNYCPLIVNTSVDYIAGGKITVEVPDSEDAEAFLNDVYDQNGLLTKEMMKTITVMGKKGDVFLKLFVENKKIKIRVIRPDICFPRYKTDDYMEMIYCAIQWWDDGDKFDDSIKPKMKAQVFRPERVDFYELESADDPRDMAWESQATHWQLVKTEKNPLGFIPIIHIKNTVDDMEFGVSDLHPMLPLQDALNKTITDMLLVMDQQAWQRVYLFGSQSPKGLEHTVAPGMVTEVSDPQGHLDVIQPSAIEPFVKAMLDIVDHIMTITSTSKVNIMKPDSPLPPSGYALRIHFIPTERKADKKLAVLQGEFRELNKMILEAHKIMGGQDWTSFKTRLHFALGLPVDELSKQQIDEGQIRMKTKSRWTTMEENGTEDIPAEMARIEEEEDGERQKELEMQIKLAEETAKFQAAARPKPSA